MDIKDYSERTFEEIKKVNEYGAEYWYGRDLARVLGYKRWENFVKLVEKAKEACKNSGVNALDHIAEVSNMIETGKSAKREVDDFYLSRYACYLIVQNGDPRKEVIALGQTYFAVKTREREIQEEFEQLSEDGKRLAIRNDLKEHNKSLVDAAKNAGVETSIDYAVFQNYGYMGLYGGLKAKDIHERKGLKKSQKILDHMGSTELAANLFRATQTDEKLRRENIKGRDKANEIHLYVGKKVRQTIEELGGTMPEDLPTPQKSVKQIEKERRGRIDEE